MLRKRIITLAEGLIILCLDDNRSNSVQESSPNEESNDFSNDFSANKPSTSKTKWLNKWCLVSMALEEVLEEDHVIGRKIPTQQT